MAIIKCKMCGGDLQVEAGQTVAECEYCGSRQTIPSADDEKKLKLFDRANRLRIGCEYDKAAGIYESIVADFPQEAEAYWGLILCKYGIEYVDDPATGNKIPTCHRSSFESVMDEPNFELVMENADAVAKKVYREEAKCLEELRKGIIEVSGKEAPYDIFICYKETAADGQRTLDSVLAQDVYDALTEKGYRVFFSRITLEDKLGREYEPYIFAALNSARVMLAFGTDYDYFNAVWVKNEWSRYLQLMTKDREKHLIPCFKDIDAYDMPKEFAKLQAQDLGKVGAIQDLLRGIEKLLPKQTKQEAPAAPVSQRVVSKSTLDNADTYLELKNYDQAFAAYSAAVKSNAADHRGWWGMIAAKTKNFNQSNPEYSKDLQTWYTYVQKLAPAGEFPKLKARYDRFIQEFLLTAEDHLKKQDTKNAMACFQLVSQMAPEEYRAWWGMFRVKTSGLTECGNDYVTELKTWFGNVKKYAPKEEFPAIKAQFDKYVADFIVTGNNKLNQQDYDSAFACYSLMSRVDESVYQSWWGMIIAKTKSFTVDPTQVNALEQWYGSLKKYAPAENFAQFEKPFTDYLNRTANLQAQSRFGMLGQQKADHEKKAKDLAAGNKESLLGRLIIQIVVLVVSALLFLNVINQIENPNKYNLLLVLGLDGLLDLINTFGLILWGGVFVVCLICFLVSDIKKIKANKASKKTGWQRGEVFRRRAELCGQLMALGLPALARHYFSVYCERFGMKVERDPRVGNLLAQIDAPFETQY